MISQSSLNNLTCNVWNNTQTYFTPTSLDTKQQYSGLVDIEHFCAPVIHPIVGEIISNHKTFAKDPATMKIWTTAFGKEFMNVAQGDKKTNTSGTDFIFTMEPNEIKDIPEDRTITYVRLVVDYRPQKKDSNRA